MIAPCVSISTGIRHAVITEVSCLVSLPITGTRNPVQTGGTTIGTLSKKTRESVRLNRFTTWNRNLTNVSKYKFKIWKQEIK